MMKMYDKWENFATSGAMALSFPLWVVPTLAMGAYVIVSGNKRVEWAAPVAVCAAPLLAVTLPVALVGFMGNMVGFAIVGELQDRWRWYREGDSAG